MMYNLVLFKRKRAEWGVVSEDDIAISTHTTLAKWGKKWYECTILKKSGE